MCVQGSWSQGGTRGTRCGIINNNKKKRQRSPRWKVCEGISHALISGSLVIVGIPRPRPTPSPPSLSPFSNKDSVALAAAARHNYFVALPARPCEGFEEFEGFLINSGFLIWRTLTYLPRSSPSVVDKPHHLQSNVLDENHASRLQITEVTRLCFNLGDGPLAPLLP